MAKPSKIIYAVIEYYPQEKTAFIYRIYNSFEEANEMKERLEDWMKKFNKEHREFGIIKYEYAKEPTEKPPLF